MPLSIQMLVRKLASTTIRNPIPFSDDIVLTDRYPLLGKARDALLSPAAQQLLRYQTKREVIGRNIFGPVYGDVTAAETSLYNSFQQEYQAKLGAAHVPVGTPGQPCRVVAVSNGTECGLTQPFGPYALLASYSSNDKYTSFGLLDALSLPILGSAGAGILNYFAPAVAGPIGIALVGIASIGAIGLTGAYDLTAVVDLRALPDHQALPICGIFLQVTKHTRLFGLFRLQFDLLKYDGGSSLASELPIDSGSGSIISLADYAAQFGDAASAIPPGLLKATQFCFEPTYSALNITPSGTAALSARYSPTLPTGTPFANFRTATRQNESHVQYTDPNSNWMLKELRQTPQVLSCQEFCQANPSINVPGAICSSGTTFSINGLPVGTTVTWELLTTASASPKQYVGPTYTVSFGSGYGTGGVVRATITSDCGNISLQTPVYVGPPAIPTVEQQSPDDVCYSQTAYYNITNYDPSLTYTIRASGSNAYFCGNSFRLKGFRSQQISFTLTASNSCGTTSTQGELTVDCSGNFTVYPNPANEEVAVYQTDSPAGATAQLANTRTPAATAEAQADAPITVRLYDNYGQLRLERAGNALAGVRLPTAALPAGFYVVQILRGGAVVSRKQLQVQR